VPKRPSDFEGGIIGRGSVGPEMVGLRDPELELKRGGSCVPGESGGRENHFDGLDKNPVMEEGDAERGKERNVDDDGSVIGDEPESEGRLMEECD
jgi:hypothetical protein